MGEDPGEVAARRYLEVDKLLQGRRMRWRPKGLRTDFRSFSAIVTVTSGEFENGVLHLTAHVYRVPYKYGFNLSWRGADILRLDVNPGGSHRNITTKIPVKGTHWHLFPSPDAIPDARDLPHRVWLDNFLRRANIDAGRLAYMPPPFERYQHDLPL